EVAAEGARWAPGVLPRGILAQLATSGYPATARPVGLVGDRIEHHTHAQAAPLRAFVELELRAVRARNAVGDGQTQAVPARGRARHAVEALQHALALGRGDARAVVLDLQPGLTAPGRLMLPAAQRDMTPRRCVLDGVVDQVDQQFPQQPGVAARLRRT